MRAVNLKYAKTHLDRLVDEAMAGEEIVISKGGTPVVRLAPVVALKKRVFGLDEGKIVIRDDFDAPLPELEGRIDLTDAEVERLAEILDRGFSPTPALRKALSSLADPKRQPPRLNWKETAA